MENYLSSTQVAVLLGISEPTLNFWYRFKRENPDNEYAQLLPDFIQMKNHQKRYWKREDLWALAKFQQAIPKGRGGIMGCVTQRYVKEKKNGKKNRRNKKQSR